MASNRPAVASYAFMPDRNFPNVAEELEQTAAKLRKIKEPDLRREFLRYMVPAQGSKQIRCSWTAATQSLRRALDQSSPPTQDSMGFTIEP
jgi:hypothetical protein